MTGGEASGMCVHSARPTCGHRGKTATVSHGDGPRRNTPAGTLVLNLQPLETRGRKFLLFKPQCLWCLLQQPQDPKQ